jgi:archaemetzincin
VNSIDVIPLSGSGIWPVQTAGQPCPTEPGVNLLESLAASLARTFRTPCRIRPEPLDVSATWDSVRRQYYSTAILQLMERAWERPSAPDRRVLGVTVGDLYVPVLTFVFGEAQVDGNCATVSTARLREEFYGLPADEALFRARLIKESVHEFGHTFGLRHCADWRCVMSSSYAVERLEVKSARFCAACGKVVFGRQYW